MHRRSAIGAILYTLIGAYMLLPLAGVDNPHGPWRIDVQSPLAEWSIFGQYGSLEACETDRAAWTRKLTDALKDFRLDDALRSEVAKSHSRMSVQEGKRFMGLTISALSVGRCVRSDDPRL